MKKDKYKKMKKDYRMRGIEQDVLLLVVIQLMTDAKGVFYVWQAGNQYKEVR